MDPAKPGNRCNPSSKILFKRAVSKAVWPSYLADHCCKRRSPANCYRSKARTIGGDEEMTRERSGQDEQKEERNRIVPRIRKAANGKWRNKTRVHKGCVIRWCILISYHHRGPNSLLAHDKYAISARIFPTSSHKEMERKRRRCNLFIIRLQSISLVS